MLFVFMALTAMGVNISFTGSSKKILSVDPDRKTGLDKIYVIWNIEEVTAMEIAGADNSLTISRYSNLGGGFAEPVSYRWKDVDTAMTDHPEGNMGYIITSGGTTTYIWLVNYSSYPFTISDIRGADEQDCDNTLLIPEGSGPAITYYSIDGRPVELSRNIEVNYTNLEWDDNTKEYDRKKETKSLPHLTDPITLLTPLYCSTEVEICGDAFLKEWGIEQRAVSSTLQPNGIEVHTEAVEIDENESDLPDSSSNLIGGKGDGMGGSAPCHINFTAYVTDAVIHDEWQISGDPEFENIDYRFNTREIEYTFEDEGVFYIRYIGSDATGKCEAYGETYTVSIGASELKIPNAFTPNDDGVNDIWKVAYRSLLNFKCWIFDRYGNEIYYFSNPNDGWDGRYKGKKVKSGVYYYVIEAKGADGKTYKKGGDINILDYKAPRTSSN